MYLSRLILNPRNRRVRGDLADCQELHRSVLSGFSAKTSTALGARQEFGVLYRLDTSRHLGAPFLLVQSAVEPDWSLLLPDYLVGGDKGPNPAVTSLDAFFNALQAGEVLRFRLRANPTKKVDTRSGPNGERRNGRRIKLKTDVDQIQWLDRKAVDGGFAVVSVRADADVSAVEVQDEGQLRGRRKHADGPARRLTFGTVLFDGHLRVTDPDQLRRTVAAGIGSGKAYGFGLLSLAREASLRVP